MKYSEMLKRFREAGPVTVVRPSDFGAGGRVGSPFREIVFELSGILRKGAGPPPRSLWVHPGRRPLSDWTIWPDWFGFTEWNQGARWSYPEDRARVLDAFRQLGRGG